MRPATVIQLAFVVASTLGGCAEGSPSAADQVPVGAGFGSVTNGKLAIQQYACISCHIVQGVVGPNVWVGPPLREFAKQKYIAGVLDNTPDNLILWIMHPQSVAPATAMPAMGVKEEHARDIAAYLYSLDD